MDNLACADYGLRLAGCLTEAAYENPARMSAFWARASRRLSKLGKVEMVEFIADNI